jgi:molecular chaperone DnaJ
VSGVPVLEAAAGRRQPPGCQLSLRLLGVGAMNSPRYAPAGLLTEYGGARVAIDGGPGAAPARPPDAWLVTDERAELIRELRRLAAAHHLVPRVASFAAAGLRITPCPVVHTSHRTFGYLIEAAGRKVAWAPEFLEFPAWAAGADLMFADAAGWARPIRFARGAGGHAAALTVAEQAKAHGVRRLVFAHIGRPTIAALEAGRKPPFGEFGADGAVYTLGAGQAEPKAPGGRVHRLWAGPAAALQPGKMDVRRDYYQVLGVPPDADAKAIRNAFRQLARRYHPDVSADPDAERRFREIAEAYGVLSDPDKRARYDERGFAGVAGVSTEDLWGGIDFADIFGPGGALFGGLFERLFGSPGQGRPQGEDLRVDLVISLDRVLTGGEEPVTIRRPGRCPQCAGSGARPGTAPHRCPDCGGSGQRVTARRGGSVIVRQVTVCPACLGRGDVVDQPCPGCGGTGEAMLEDRVTIRIPRGVPEGTTLRLAGRGMPGPGPGAPPGDAYVVVRTGADPRFTRQGADLWCDLHIGPPDAALGSTAAVPAPDGQAQVEVPPGTQPGAVLRVPGQGLPRYRGRGRGSLNVTVIVDVPRQLSPWQRLLYDQLRMADAGAADEPGRHPARGKPRARRRRGRGAGQS